MHACTRRQDTYMQPRFILRRLCLSHVSSDSHPSRLFIQNAHARYLRAGTFYLKETVSVTSGVTISAYNNEDVVVSGGVELNPQWTKVSSNSSYDTYVLPPQVSTNRLVSPVDGIATYERFRIHIMGGSPHTHTCSRE